MGKRSKWKVPYMSNIYFSKFFFEKKIFFSWKRNVVISNFFLNKRFRIHNGIWLLSCYVKTNMVGHKIGEFSITKKLGRDIHQNNKKR